MPTWRSSSRPTGKWRSSGTRTRYDGSEEVEREREKGERRHSPTHPHPQNKDPQAKERFQQISVAYSRLVAGPSLTDEEAAGRGGKGGPNNKGGKLGKRDQEKYGEDVDEMRAFMRMFMVSPLRGGGSSKERGKGDVHCFLGGGGKCTS